MKGRLLSTILTTIRYPSMNSRSCLMVLEEILPNVGTKVCRNKIENSTVDKPEKLDWKKDVKVSIFIKQDKIASVCFAVIRK